MNFFFEVNLSNVNCLTIEKWMEMNKRLYFFISVISVALIYSWCKTESKERNSVAPGH
jgi:hypothetical protein